MIRGRRRKGSEAHLVAEGEGRLRVDGVLDFGTVSALLAQGESLIPPTGEVRIDLGGVASANSAGLALLLEWLDRARARGVRLVYLNLPESLARIAAFSNLRALLPIEPAPEPPAAPASASAPAPA